VVILDAEQRTNNMYGKPFKMMGKSPMMKKLVGKQNNLPEELKAKIEASPAKKYGADSPVKQDKNKSKAKINNKDILGFNPNMRAGDESMGDYVSRKLKIRQNKRQPYMKNSAKITRQQDKLDKADIIEKRKI